MPLSENTQKYKNKPNMKLQISCLITILCIITGCHKEEHPIGVTTPLPLEDPSTAICDSLKQDSKFVRITPVIEPIDGSITSNFIIGMKENKLWLNTYDNDWACIQEHHSTKPIETNYHVGYGVYGELYDMFLSLIYYDDNIKFLEIYFIYKDINQKYYIRCQSAFINDNNFIVVNDTFVTGGDYYEIMFSNIDSYIDQIPYKCNLRPINSSRWIKPWVDNSFLYSLRNSGTTHICYNLADYSIIFKSEEEYEYPELTSYKVENAINHEEVIIAENNICRLNIKTRSKIWEYSFIKNNLVPNDAKHISTSVDDRTGNKWKFTSNWTLYDGSQKTINTTIDIDTGTRVII